MYENRQPANYSFGTLSSAAAVSDTTLNSAEFAARLAAGLDTTTYVPITLQDPATGAFEIVWATGHTAGATAATVVRGREGTSAVAWPSSTLWTCSPTLRDGSLPVANKAALPTDMHVGGRAYLLDQKALVAYNGMGWGYDDSVLYGATADSTVNNTASFANAAGLSVPMAASAKYAIEAWVVYASNATANIKFLPSVPAGATGFWSTFGPYFANASRIGDVDTGLTDLASNLAASGDNSGAQASCRMVATVTTAAAAGNFQLRFAQNTANGSNTTVKAASWIRATRVG